MAIYWEHMWNLWLDNDSFLQHHIWDIWNPSLLWLLWALLMIRHQWSLQSKGSVPWVWLGEGDFSIIKELKFCGVQCGHAWPQPTSCMVRECTVLSPDCSLALAGDEGCRMKGWRKDGLNFLVPSNSDVEIPVPSVMVCGDGVFERWLGLEEVMRVNHSQWDSCRYEIRHELVSSSCSLPCEVKQEDAIYKPGSGSSPETGFAGILTLDFPTSRTMRNNCYLSLPVMAAQVESVSGKNHFWSQGLYSLNSTVCYSSKLTNANWIYLFSHFSLCSVIERSKGT